MARAALNWRVGDLALRAEASTQTVTRFEGGAELKESTIQRFREQFEKAGILFIEEDKIAGEGVRLPKPKAKRSRK